MNLVRVNNLRELIYKNGQAGVAKAVVTIEFDNTDQNQSPTGYENDKIITIRKEVTDRFLFTCLSKYQYMSIYKFIFIYRSH